MAVYPQALEIDQTPTKLLYQAAQQASENQQQMLQMANRNEQIRREAFGSAQKQLFDIANAQNLPVDVQNSILKKGLEDLKLLYKNQSQVRSSDLGVVASNVLLDAKQKANAFQQYLSNGEKIIADLKEKGFDEVNMKSALSNSVFENLPTEGKEGNVISRIPKDPTKLGDPIQFITKEIDSNPHKYLNREFAGKKLNEFINNYKPAELEQSSTVDQTGMKTTKVSSLEKTYPWSRVAEEKDPATGKTVKINVLDTEPLTDGNGNIIFSSPNSQNPTQILSTNAYNKIVSSLGNDVSAVKEIDAMGRDAIDDHNRMRGVNPQQITPENFETLSKEYQGLINPFDANNRMIFSRIALTNKLMPQFGRFGKTSVTIDAAKPTVVNVNSDLYTRTGNIRPEARFPTAWAQIINQDADVMRVAENMSFQYDGKTITGRRTGDRAYQQVIKDNGNRATVVSRPEEPGTIYVVELDKDGEATDNVLKLSGQQAIDYGAKISSANGSDIKSYNKLYKSATKTVVPMSDSDKANVGADVNKAAALEEGKALLGRVSQIRGMAEGETITADNALVKLNGKDVKIKSIYRKDTGWFSDSPVIVTLSDNTTMTFNNRDEFANALVQSNK